MKVVLAVGNSYLCVADYILERDRCHTGLCLPPRHGAEGQEMSYMDRMTANMLRKFRLLRLWRLYFENAAKSEAAGWVGVSASGQRPYCMLATASHVQAAREWPSLAGTDHSRSNECSHANGSHAQRT